MKTKLETLIEEANAQAKEHPSKDARYFANSVHKYLTTLAQPEQEPVWWMSEDGEKAISTTDMLNYPDYEYRYSIPLYTTPPQRPRVVFPTMLRKMWSGSEVQAWIDENVNKENWYES